VALEENHPEHAVLLLHVAIAEFETEKEDPDAADAYVLLSRALLMRGNLEEAGKAVQRAAELSRTNPDLNLKLPVAIQNARVDIAAASQNHKKQGLDAARTALRSAIATAKKSGYYTWECEGRLALANLEARTNPAAARAQLLALASEARGRGLELLARHAEESLGTAEAAPGAKPAGG